jgi:hypothetical protein
VLSDIAVRGGGRSRVAVVLLALCLPVFFVNAWSGAFADRLGDRIAARLIEVVPPPPPPRATEDEWSGAAELAFDTRSDVRAAAFQSKQPQKSSRPRVTPKQGIRVTSAQVLALAARGAMPRAVFVKSTVEHPAGLLLSGVSALGIGLRDGDILTDAAGEKATSVAMVVGLVLAARSRRASDISGRFYRGGVPFLLTVEQPYPKPPVPG